MRRSFIVLLALLAAVPAHAASMPSYWCSFTEPFISVFSGSDALVYENSGEDERVSAPDFKPAAGGGEISGLLKKGDRFSVKIKSGTGSDGMSDFDFPLTGVLAGSPAISGGCLKLPDGTKLRHITGVAPDDNLTLRDGPSVKAMAINKIKLEYVWLKSSHAQKGWVQVIVLVFPKGESGMIKTAEGWVNGKFLAKVRP